MKMLKSLAIAATMIFATTSSQAALYTYNVALTDVNGVPAPFGPSGSGTITLDDTTFMMISDIHVSLINGLMTGGMLFGPTALPYTGTAPAVSNPFTSFPTNVTIGRASGTLNMTLPGSYDPGFLAGYSGNTAAAFANFKAAADNGQIYLTIGSTTFPGGSIQGFLTPVPEPTSACLLAIGAGMGLMRRRRSHIRTV
jgi:CHRD domain